MATAKAVTIMPLIPAPAQTMIIGPRAILGSALSMTMYGSSTFARKLDHHNIIATRVPKTVPTVKPTIVSNTLMPICLYILPL